KAIDRFDIVAVGDHWGQGPHTRRPRPGRQPLGGVFELASGKARADLGPPQAPPGSPAYPGHAPKPPRGRGEGTTTTTKNTKQKKEPSAARAKRPDGGTSKPSPALSASEGPLRPPLALRAGEDNE